MSFPGPLLAVGTILVMTVPADFDIASTATPAVCHVTLVPIRIAAVVAIGRRTQATRTARAKA